MRRILVGVAVFGALAFSPIAEAQNVGDSAELSGVVGCTLVDSLGEGTGEGKAPSGFLALSQSCVGYEFNAVPVCMDIDGPQEPSQENTAVIGWRIVSGTIRGQDATGQGFIAWFDESLTTATHYAEFAAPPESCPDSAGGPSVIPGSQSAGDTVAATITNAATPPPDRDGDGVPDDQDTCPDLAGDRENGCPTPPNKKACKHYDQYGFDSKKACKDFLKDRP